MTRGDLSNPILNSPFDVPDQHFEIGRDGPTGVIIPGRRPSESFVPIRLPKRGQEQAELDFDATAERIERNTLINDIRREVELWRARGYAGVTPYTRKLLEHWKAAPPDRDDPVFFCQREAAETAIFLTEVAGRHGATADYRARLEPINELHNEGLPRVGLKMATGTGKTVVMAMLIAWHTINKVHLPRDARFTSQFLVVTPGITIRNRLRVLFPADDGNYYRERDLVPSDLWPALMQAQVVIMNFHQFLPKDAREIQGVASNTRKLLIGDKKSDPFKESEEQMVARVLRDLPGQRRGEIVVLSDEAHHCYKDKPDDTKVDAEDKERNEEARVWFKGLRAIDRVVGIKTIYDTSATPYYLRGSGYEEGEIFPWVVSDFSLMDAIESGIVKVPRVPIDDDARGEFVTYLRLWDHIGDRLPKKKTTKSAPTDWVPPEELEGALRSLYRSYEAAFARWETHLAELGEPPPVMIVVCPNTVVSELVFNWIAGVKVEAPDGSERLRPGWLAVLSNVTDGAWIGRQPTILIDSKQLESGETLKADFKKAVTTEIDAFKAEYRRRYPGADVDKITDEDLLREVMNTVGKRGKLGEHVRCVVSVSMLTEGWDANTVSHILGIRRFGSQLLCEQVVGRGLRRRSYATNEERKFEPEHAEVYGVPFAFIPSDRPPPTPVPQRPAILVEAVPERADLEIRFPKLDGYRSEVTDPYLDAVFDGPPFVVDRDTVALWTQTQGILGGSEEQDLSDVRDARPQRVAFEIAKVIVERHMSMLEGDPRPWLFQQVAGICRRFLTEAVQLVDDSTVGMLLLAEGGHRAAEHVFNAIVSAQDAGSVVLRPVFRRFDPDGSTASVSFPTRKAAIPTIRSHVSHVVLDGPKGNTWEEEVAGIVERHPDVHAFVKNDHLGFGVPYVHQGRSHTYVPDFIVRLKAQENDDTDRTLIIEVSGGRKSPGPTKAKADTTRDQWCVAVNNHGGWGRWDYLEIADMTYAKRLIDDAIDDMVQRTSFSLR